MMHFGMVFEMPNLRVIVPVMAVPYSIETLQYGFYPLNYMS